MTTLRTTPVSGRMCPQRTITAGGVEFAYRELGRDKPRHTVVSRFHLAA